MESSSAGVPGGPQPCDLLIAGGILLTLNAERLIITDAAVAITGPRITAVGKRAALAPRFAPARTIDGRGKLVMPGLMNCHTHLQVTAKGAEESANTRNALKDFIYPMFAAQTEESQHWDAALVMIEMIKTGTTTCCEPNATHWGSAVQAAVDVGMRAAIGPWTWDQQGPDAAKCPPDFRKLDADACLAQLEDGIRRYNGAGDGRVKATASIEGVGTCSDALSVGIKELASKYGTLAAQHKASSKEEVEIELRAFGQRPLEHMYRIGALGPNVLLAHMVCLDDDEVQMCAETDTKISQNPSPALKLVKGTTVFGKFPELHAAGVGMGLGTDAVNASNFMDIVRAMYLCTVLPRDSRLAPGITKTETAVELATLGGARALDWAQDLGSLEPGKLADITLFDTERPEWQPLYNPVSNLVYSADGHSAHTVIIDGKVVMEAQKMVTVDEHEVMKRQRASSEQIIKKLGLKLTPAWPVI
jgi:5-methylthioadenosine/S-adenosylhomocysteine deaminase